MRFNARHPHAHRPHPVKGTRLWLSTSARSLST
nr:MAG TPA: hypothetical protein [Caudoviricetes sp.]